MTIKRKASKAPPYAQTDIEDIEGKIERVIGGGGKMASEGDPKSTQQINPIEEEDIRFTLRISASLIKKIDGDRKSRVGNVSRNQWILEAVNNYLLKPSNTIYLSATNGFTKK